MIEIRFDFGVGATKDGCLIPPREVSVGKDRLLHFVSGLSGGCSIVAREGARLEKGYLIIEPGYTLVVLTVTSDFVLQIVDFIKLTFQQKSVSVIQTAVDATFY